MTASPALSLMFQGTGSDVGKSLIVAGLCRAYANRGLAVLPFKPQNMSNNAAVTADGGEIGRAQWLQARAARATPSVHMNPVLLKPQTDIGAQVIVQGKVRGTAAAMDYQTLKAELMDAVMDSYDHLRGRADLVLVEGAGSPAEVNLRAHDIANMGFARRARCPVVLIGDIDRGGVIASLAGTHAILEAEDRAMITGFLINKFRGDVRLFDDGYRFIADKTGWPGFGVVPFWRDAGKLPAEDAVVLERPSPAAAEKIHIAIPMLSRISNFDDFDPLKLEPDVLVEFVPPGWPLPREADVIILPGSKATIADLNFLRAQGWHIDLLSHLRHGGRVLGICGGYQMLGRTLYDPDGIEGPPGQSAEGLGLLDLNTRFAATKRLEEVSGRHLLTGQPVTGYEMHMGRSTGPATTRPMVLLNDRPDGARSEDGLVEGCYLHGLFAEDAFRAAWLRELRPGRRASTAYAGRVDHLLDGLADHLERHLDLDALLQAARAFRNLP
ncbi:cobyric acid synthase [Luteithermobacter gelatinilyticus]|uniref:cobyric acid synthase n=1 Tax=Luteithermobacter gelatinilyticus TaxID=2582913 RepID=UPI001107594B|nr:cobyric acid synthase [Luteithermobacter gelatinilyticus]